MQFFGIGSNPIICNSTKTQESHFTESLQKAECIFKTNGPGKDLTKILNEAYINLPSTDASIYPQLSRLFYMYGRCFYSSDKNVTRKFCAAALHLQLSSVGMATITPSIFFRKASLKALCDDLDNHSKFIENQFLDLFGLSSKVSFAPYKVFLTLSESFETSQAFEVATYFRWYGHACQNLSDYILPSQINQNRFEKVYGEARTLLRILLETSKDANGDINWEAGQLEYNTGRLLYELNFPNDPLGKSKQLEKVLPYLEKEGETRRAQTLKAQIKNMTAMSYYGQLAKQEQDPTKKQEFLEKAFELHSEAVTIAEETQGGFENKFLYYMFYNNKAASALEAGKTNYDEMKTWIKKAVDYADEQIQQEGADIYYSFYYNNAARIAHRCGDSADVYKYIAKAEKIITDSPEATPEDQKYLDKLKKELGIQ